MQVRAFIFIETDPGKPKEVAKAISKMDGVSLCHAVAGPFDVVAYLECKNMGEISDLVIGKMHEISGVKKTTTSIVAD